MFVSQDFIQPDDEKGGQHDPHLRIIGGRCETLAGHIIYIFVAT